MSPAWAGDICLIFLDRRRLSFISDKTLGSFWVLLGGEVQYCSLLEFVLRFLRALLSLLKMWGLNLDRQKYFSEPTVTIGVLNTLK